MTVSELIAELRKVVLKRPKAANVLVRARGFDGPDTYPTKVWYDAEHRQIVLEE